MTAEEFYKDYFGHTSQHVSMDKIFVCMELYAKQYANQRVIEELEKMMKISTVKTSTVPILSLSVDLINRIEELKQ
mgnify:FL=1